MEGGREDHTRKGLSAERKSERQHQLMREMVFGEKKIVLGVRANNRKYYPRE